MKIIIPCGAKKAKLSLPAKMMYMGSYHIALQQYARSIASESDIFILSAKYGLLPLDQVIDPYDVKMGDKNEVSNFVLQEQIKRYGLDHEKVLVIAGKKYLNKISNLLPNYVDFWSAVNLPKGGMGYQIQWCKQNLRRNPIDA